MTGWVERFTFTAPPCVDGRKRHRYENFGPAVETGHGGEEVCEHCGTIRCLNTSPGKDGWTVAGYVTREKSA